MYCLYNKKLFFPKKMIKKIVFFYILYFFIKENNVMDKLLEVKIYLFIEDKIYVILDF